MADATQTNVDSMIGRLVVEQGLASSDEVKAAMERQKQLADTSPGASQKSLGDILIEQGAVTETQLKRVRPAIEQQQGSQQIPGYQLLKKLGAGAMATVYLGKQVSLDRLVAIKVLPKKFMSNPEFVERFYAEGRAAAKLNHPNIVQAYDVGKSGDFHYFVMEYVEGKTVFDDLDAGRKYSEAEALKIVLQVARALEHSHKQGFIHRDVKPKNIMLAKGGPAKLADMGLARAVSDVEAAEAEQGKAYGTPYYISPEQIRGLMNVDFRCDIYGLGATFYHLVTGRVPFDAPTPSAVMHKHLKEKLVPPDHINPNLSAGIGEVIEVCMAKNPDERYQTTGDLLFDLECIARGEPPVQARKQFDISSLAALEKSAEPIGGHDSRGKTVDMDALQAEPKPLAQQPLFWLAIGGWTVAFIIAVAYFLK
ncbi:MAG: serine/threonine-protein kinase [Phycisphaeraceae bacterium]